MSRKTWTLIAVGLIAGLAFLARAASPAAPPAPPANDHVLRAGVIDAGKVYDTMQECKELVAALTAKAQGGNAERAQREQKLRDLYVQLSQFKEDSPQWNQVRGQVDQQGVSLKAFGELSEMEIQRAEKALLKSVHQHVLDAVRKVAEDQHLDVVLADSDPDLSASHLDRMNSGQFRQLIAARAVFYTGPKADITEAVIARLDADFTKQKQGGAAGH